MTILRFTISKPTLIIGSMLGTDRFYNGIADELVIFDVALAEDDVKSLTNGMSNVMAVSPSGKLATTWLSIKKTVNSLATNNGRTDCLAVAFL